MKGCCKTGELASTTAELARRSLFGFQFAGLPWMCQEVSTIWFGFLHLSHDRLPFCIGWLCVVAECREGHVPPSGLEGNNGRDEARAEASAVMEWEEPIINFRGLSSCRTSEKADGVLAVVLSPRCGHEPSSRDESRLRRNLNTRLVSTISLNCVSSAAHFQLWDSNKSSYCESLVSALKYVVTVSSPWRTS